MPPEDSALSEQQLVELYHELLDAGYSLEPRQLESALRVLRHAASLGRPVARLSSLLVPIFAKSPAQRADCQQRLERRGLIPTRTTPEEPTLSPQGAPLGGHIWPLVVIGVLILSLAVLLALPLAKPPSQPDAQPTLPQPQIIYEQKIIPVTVVSEAYQPLRIALLLIPLFGAAGWLLLRWRWRRELLAINRGEAGFDLLDLGARAFGTDLFASRSLAQTAQHWRRHRRLGISALDLRRTVEATIARGGLFTPVTSTRPLSPRYLLLIEEESRHDHIARLIDNIVDRLSREGVWVEVYYHHGSLRNLRARSDHVERFTDLARIVAEPVSSIVVLVGSGKSLFDPATNRIDRFALSELKRWPRRAFLSTTPINQWGDRELALLHRGFALGTARERGFAAMGRHIANDFPDHHPVIEPIVVEVIA